MANEFSRVIWPEGFDERRAFETPLRGYLIDVFVEGEDGARFGLFFVDPGPCGVGRPCSGGGGRDRRFVGADQHFVGFAPGQPERSGGADAAGTGFGGGRRARAGLRGVPEAG